MAKKKAPQRLAGAEESCISPEQEAIIQWFRTVKFRKNLLGGVDEAAMWKKLEELYALYEAAIRAERTRYNKNRLGGKSRFSGVSRLSCYYRVNSSVFIGL